ncbi:hypothetical protein [Pseudomonas vanderleydeniana]|uniref:Uncharacterized protein n=1 Tax=Pseudomonas vanderleydeniana TaxID=2745495 RepID=A0A9E6PGD3_9PSED|nr:hypothetical protein [Pseudomonas vanderleydeniana]QXI25892.1 hypothetical protein HU752_018165 [Pseudomonas vanderleydeniana]
MPHHEIVGPYDPNTLFPYFCFIPAHYMTNPGFRVIRYEVSNPLIGSDESSPTFVNIDQTAPNQGNAGLRLRFEDEVEADGLSDEYLTDHGGAPVVVPRWSDLHIEDTVIFYWSKTPRLSSSDDDEDEAHTLQITYAHWVDENAPIEATIPEAVIRASGPGRRYAGYRLKDRAGNGGGFSAPTPIEVLTVAAPGDLEKPWIEEALDGLIDLADARLPLKMKIPFIDGASAGDWVMPYWNAQALPSFQLADVNTWPIPRDLSWTVVSSGGFDAPVPTRIHYLYQRGTQQPKPSDSSFFLVDLTVAGPAPEGPDPINRFLDPVTVKGVTGDNIVTSADSNRHLKVEVTLFDNPKPGERLELMWGSDAELARTYTVQQGDVAGQLLELFVPWPVVEGVGSHPRLPVYYWTDNGVNRQRSRDTLVKVAITRIEDLLAPVVVDADARNTINCETVPRPWEGIRVHVPADPRFAPGDTVTLYWKGYSTTNGAGAPIPGSEESFPRILSPEEARDGVDITVLPFNPLITLPGLVTPRNGSAVLQYSLSKQDGSYGDSKKKMIAVSLIRPSGERCLGV